MNIFIQIKNSIYNKEYYKNTVLSETMSESMKYLAKICLFVAVVFTVFISYQLFPYFKEIKNEISWVATNYPEDLIFDVKNGNASINKPVPYIIGMPDSLISKENDSENLKNFIVVDTEEPFSLNKFNEYSTIFLITKTELIAKESDGSDVRIIPFSKLGELKIDKTWILDKENLVLNKILPWVKIFILPFILGFIFIGIFIGWLLIIALHAVIVWVIFKIKKTDFSYKKSYQVAIHASTIIILLGLFSKYLLNFDNLYVRILIFILVILLNFESNPNQIKEEETIVVPKKIEEKNSI